MQPCLRQELVCACHLTLATCDNTQWRRIRPSDCHSIAKLDCTRRAQTSAKASNLNQKWSGIRRRMCADVDSLRCRRQSLPSVVKIGCVDCMKNAGKIPNDSAMVSEVENWSRITGNAIGGRRVVHVAAGQHVCWPSCRNCAILGFKYISCCRAQLCSARALHRHRRCVRLSVRHTLVFTQSCSD